MSACAVGEQKIPADGPLTAEQVESLWERAVRTDTHEEDGSWTVEWYADGRQLAMGNMTAEVYYAEYYGGIFRLLEAD